MGAWQEVGVIVAVVFECLDVEGSRRQRASARRRERERQEVRDNGKEQLR